MSLRMAKPKLAAVAGSKPPKVGTVEPKLSCVKLRSRSAVGFPWGSRPMVTLGRFGNGFPSASTRSFGFDAAVDVEVEVDTDPFEEVVVERDEANFDRDLQVLQPSQLFQQIGNLLVDFLRLADDQAQVGGKPLDRSLAADIVPGIRRDRGRDQLDQRVESRPGLRHRVRRGRSRAVAARVDRRAGILTTTSGPTPTGGSSPTLVVGQHSQWRLVVSALESIPALRIVSFTNRAGQSHVVAGDEVRNRNHQVGHIVGYDMTSSSRECFRSSPSRLRPE